MKNVNVLVRSLAFPALVAAGGAVLALGLMLASLGRNLHQLAPLEAHLAAIERIQRLAVHRYDHVARLYAGARGASGFPFSRRMESCRRGDSARGPMGDTPRR